MELLLVHQNFPGQFRELAPAWLAAGHGVTAIGCSHPEQFETANWNGLRFYPYSCSANGCRYQALTTHIRSLIRTYQLKPDLVVAHSAWGEASVIKDIWPTLPLVVYPELWGSERALGVGFDEHRQPLTPSERADIEQQNDITIHAIARADAVVIPTAFQRDGFPDPWPQNMCLIHEGVDLDQLQPDPKATLLLPNGDLLDRRSRVITYVSRQFEPLRGLHTFMAALPSLLQKEPDVQVVMVGGLGVGYDTHLQEPGGHLGNELRQLPPELDLSRLHWVGQLRHTELVRLLQISSAHVYLTYPYTLSWSVLEAMACGAPIIGNHGGPLDELILDGKNGLLINFNQPDQLTDSMRRLIADPQLQQKLGEAARQTVKRRFNRQEALQRYDRLFNALLTVEHH